MDEMSPRAVHDTEGSDRSIVRRHLEGWTFRELAREFSRPAVEVRRIVRTTVDAKMSEAAYRDRRRHVNSEDSAFRYAVAMIDQHQVLPNLWPPADDWFPNEWWDDWEWVIAAGPRAPRFLCGARLLALRDRAKRLASWFPTVASESLWAHALGADVQGRLGWPWSGEEQNPYPLGRNPSWLMHSFNPSALHALTTGPWAHAEEEAKKFSGCEPSGWPQAPWLAVRLEHGWYVPEELVARALKNNPPERLRRALADHVDAIQPLEEVLRLEASALAPEGT